MNRKQLGKRRRGSGWNDDHCRQLATGNVYLGLQDGFPDACVEHRKFLRADAPAVRKAWVDVDVRRRTREIFKPDEFRMKPWAEEHLGKRVNG